MSAGMSSSHGIANRAYRSPDVLPEVGGEIDLDPGQLPGLTEAERRRVRRDADPERAAPESASARGAAEEAVGFAAEQPTRSVGCDEERTERRSRACVHWLADVEDFFLVELAPS
jgi:hypothetical protein